MTDEEYVRSRWERISKYAYGGRTKYVYLPDLNRNFFAEGWEDTWKSAAEFTRQREIDIYRIEVQIKWLEKSLWAESDYKTVIIIGDISASRKITLTELKKGWKG